MFTQNIFFLHLSPTSFLKLRSELAKEGYGSSAVAVRCQCGVRLDRRLLASPRMESVVHGLRTRKLGARSQPGGRSTSPNTAGGGDERVVDDGDVARHRDGRSSRRRCLVTVRRRLSVQRRDLAGFQGQRVEVARWRRRVKRSLSFGVARIHRVSSSVDVHG